MDKESIHLKGLNGLRAIAAISVLVGHISSTTFCNYNFRLPVCNVGGYGVTLFFVISGFLITYLLLLEKEKTSDIKIGKFYIRRILRIWPIYYLFILIGFVISYFIADLSDIRSNHLFWYIFFTANFASLLNETVRFTVHYWSIGVEEQFYLFWPLIVKFFNKKLFVFIICFIICFLITKSLFWLYFGNTNLVYHFMSITRFHCMMIGAVGAVLYFNKNTIFIQIVSNKVVTILSWMLFLPVYFNVIALPAPISNEFIAVLSLFIIMSQILNTIPRISFENSFWDFIGKISYGIYVIHPLVIVIYSIIYKDLNIKYQGFIVYSSIIISTILISYVSYNYYEKPFLKLKTKFAIVKSQNSIIKEI